MFKKILSFVFLVALSLNLFSESIRDYVCVVEGNFSEENEKFLNQYKDEMAKSGYIGTFEYDLDYALRVIGFNHYDEYSTAQKELNEALGYNATLYRAELNFN